jgi:integrase/recombinase XerD
MDVLDGVRMTGPLAQYARGLAGELARLGFTELSAQCQLGLAAHLSRWLAAAGLGTAALTTAVVDAYLAARRAAGYRAYLTPKALAPLLGYLRGLGVAPQPEVPAPQTWAKGLVDGYRRWLLAERGLGVKAACGYVDSVRPFVAAHAAGGEAGLQGLGAGDVMAFLTAESRRLAPKTVQRLATALRSLPRDRFEVCQPRPVVLLQGSLRGRRHHLEHPQKRFHSRKPENLQRPPLELTP